MNTFTVVVLTFVIFMTVLSTTEGRPLVPLRCQCARTYSGKPIPIHRIETLKNIPAGPHCKNEIIITMKHKQTQNCLNPEYDWVKSLDEEMNKKSASSGSKSQ